MNNLARILRTALLPSLIALSGCGLLKPVPKDLDLATSRPTEQGLYHATITRSRSSS